MSKSAHTGKIGEIKQIGENAVEFVIRPLHPGYGNTLGNSLRRVLLGSIEGGAMTSFSVEGATHEFTTIKGVREDIVDIMLNIKNIHLRIHSDEPVTLELEKSGAGPVTAADIKKNANVEIANPDQLIATIDDPKGSIKMRFTAENGFGYRSVAESSAMRKDPTMIALDAVFTPVVRVRYESVDTRVGQNTNLDELRLQVKTDGTLKPEEALERAAAALVNQFQALSGATVVEAAAPPIAAIEAAAQKTTPLEELTELSTRTINALKKNGVETIEELTSKTSDDLKGFASLGASSIAKIEEAIKAWKGGK